jgi:hypothetical protein
VRERARLVGEFLKQYERSGRAAGAPGSTEEV